MEAPGGETKHIPVGESGQKANGLEQQCLPGRDGSLMRHLTLAGPLKVKERSKVALRFRG